ncbi:ABC-F family ATP-binding cassette domain-containing protein [Ornithinimicrobium murale]|uniref:ABC-F family ATP-binding cassette domain-containing protein n=1 Tax=Ornithinimicrobium murale TaxID=1050153 RepID=UPI000E0D06F0|nr:ABC-F family ATP-binding cassette domain-containing protein [Ornithinimicrobium murale]
MANLIATDRARLIAGTQVLLDDVSLGVLDGERIGVLGRNGGGKTSLLGVLQGNRELDTGRVLRPAGVTSGMLAQADVLDPDATVRQVVLGDLAEHEWAGDPRVREIVSGLLGDLGATVLGGLDSPVGAKSGGELRRLALAALLVRDPDLLLLDEPTNHLDVEGVAWLAAYLSQRRPRPGSGLVFVTHDRWFLDAVATRTWEVSDGQVHSYDGGYAAYVLARAERARVAAVTEERRNNLLRKELAWLQRGAPARTSKPRFRIDAAEALVANEPPPRDSVELVRFATTRLGKDVLDLLDATVRLGDRVLLDDVTWRIGPGDRFGIVGVNGAGKSTLFRALMGQIPLEDGTLKTGKTVRLACLSQDLRELEAVAGRTVIDAITQVRSFTVLGGKEISASQLATRLGFTGGRQQSRVGDLSGGERRRLQFLRLLMDEPNVLLLDEPTNDLDIDTLTSMEDVLDGWAGTLLVVSHDRYLLERMTDRQVALLGDGGLRDLPGGVEQYLELRRAMQTRAERGGPAPQASGGSHSTAKASGGAQSGGSSAPRAAEVREARKTVARVEKALARLGERETRVHEEMVAQATNAEAMMRLSAQLAAIRDERETLELEWLEAAELAD